VVLLFFGYTFCPDACPMTMSKIADALGRVDGARDQVVVYFVTVDVDRDTPDVLARYVDSFGVPMVGLTGTRAEVDAVVDQYRASYEITPSDSRAGPQVGHTTYTYLIDRAGAVRYLFSFDEPASRIAEGVALALGVDPPATSAATDETPPRTAAADPDVERGRAIYNGERGLCYTCHRLDLGGLVGPSLVDDYWLEGCTAEDIARSTETGFPARGMMPFGSGQVLTEEELGYVAAYILSRQGSAPDDPKPPDPNRERRCP